jgi:hypothetical protein
MPVHERAAARDAETEYGDSTVFQASMLPAGPCQLLSDLHDPSSSMVDGKKEQDLKNTILCGSRSSLE